jgi:hypothetical protein
LAIIFLNKLANYWWNFFCTQIVWPASVQIPFCFFPTAQKTLSTIEILLKRRNLSNLIDFLAREKRMKRKNMFPAEKKNHTSYKSLKSNRASILKFKMHWPHSLTMIEWFSVGAQIRKIVTIFASNNFQGVATLIFSS